MKKKNLLKKLERRSLHIKIWTKSNDEKEQNILVLKGKMKNIANLQPRQIERSRLFTLYRGATSLQPQHGTRGRSVKQSFSRDCMQFRLALGGIFLLLFGLQPLRFTRIMNMPPLLLLVEDSYTVYVSHLLINKVSLFLKNEKKIHPHIEPHNQGRKPPIKLIQMKGREMNTRRCNFKYFILI